MMFFICYKMVWSFIGLNIIYILELDVLYVLRVGYIFSFMLIFILCILKILILCNCCLCVYFKFFVDSFNFFDRI